MTVDKNFKIRISGYKYASLLLFQGAITTCLKLLLCKSNRHVYIDIAITIYGHVNCRPVLHHHVVIFF